MRANCWGMMPRLSYDTFLMVSSERVIAAIPMKLPTSIISGSMVCSVPPNDSTPSITNKLDAIPEILAPMRLSILHNCCK